MTSSSQKTQSGIASLNTTTPFFTICEDNFVENPEMTLVYNMGINGLIKLLEEFEENFDLLPRATLVHHSFRAFAKTLDFEWSPMEGLERLRNYFSYLPVNLPLPSFVDTIRSFVLLTKATGRPKYVKHVHLNPSHTKFIAVFNDFKISMEVDTRMSDFEPIIKYRVNKRYAQMKLLLSGDVETNPGPNTHSKMIDAKRIQELERIVRQLKKKEEKRDKYVQRQLEMEKRDRNRNRKEASSRKYAQGDTGLIKQVFTKLAQDTKDTIENPGLVADALKTGAVLATNAIAPGVGTAAACMVQGAKVNSTVNTISAGIQPVLDTLNELLTKLTSCVDSVLGAFKISSTFDIIRFVTDLILVARAIMSGNKTTLAVSLIGLARSLNIDFGSMMNLFPGTPQGNQTSGESMADLLNVVKQRADLLPIASFTTFFLAVFTYLCSGKLPDSASALNMFSIIGRAANGFRAARDVVSYIFEYMSEIYYTYAYGLSKEQYQLSLEYPELEKLLAACPVVKEIPSETIKNSKLISQQILGLYTDLTTIRDKASRGNRKVATMIDVHLRGIDSQVKVARSSPALVQSIRKEPFALYLYGDPGVGKTILTNVFHSKIYKDFIAVDGNTLPFASSKYTVRVDNEYHDTYTHQPVVCFDDFANIVDSPQAPNMEFGEIISMVNTEQYSLHMADLAQKSCTYFDSEFILASSNQKVPIVKSRADAGAIYRRFHIWAHVEINSDYGVLTTNKNGAQYYKYDAVKAKQKYEKEGWEWNGLPTRQYRITLYTFSADAPTVCSPVPNASNLTFDEFYDIYVKRLTAHRMRCDVQQEALLKMAGITLEVDHLTETEVLKRFKKIFNPEALIDEVDEQEDPAFEDAQNDEFQFADDLFEKPRVKQENSKFRELYIESRKLCHAQFVKARNKMRHCGSYLASAFRGVADFIYSIFSSLLQCTATYLPIFATPSALLGTGFVTIAWYFISAWSAGAFRVSIRDPTKFVDPCSFVNSPSANDSPCKQCDPCLILDFPKSGDMVAHYLSRAVIPQVLRELGDAYFPPCQVLRAFASCQAENKFPKRYLGTCKGYDSDESGDEFDEHADYHDRYLSDKMARGEKAYDHAKVLRAKARVRAERAYDAVKSLRGKTHARAEGGSRKEIVLKTPHSVNGYTYAEGDVVQIEQTASTMMKNAMWLQAADENNLCNRSNALFLGGRTFITTAHTLRQSAAGGELKKIFLTNPYSAEPTIRNGIPIKDCKITFCTNKNGDPTDVAMVTVPEVLPARPRIITKFLEARDLDYITEGEAVFTGFHAMPNGITVTETKYPTNLRLRERMSYLEHRDGQCPKKTHVCSCPPLTIGCHVEYDVPTGPGQCGSLISIRNALINRKLIGIHVAGSAHGPAYGVVTTKEFLLRNFQAHAQEHALKPHQFIDGRIPTCEGLIDTTKVPKLVAEGDCNVVGIGPSPVAPTKTVLSPSLIHDQVVKHTTKPAHLRPITQNDVVKDPMTIGIKKVLGTQLYIDPIKLDIAVKDVFEKLGRGTGRVLSYEEAITGVEGDPYLRPINRRTSPGYPYTLTKREGKGKQAWLGCDEEYIVDDPELKADVMTLLDKAADCVRGDVISTATLKDERRPIEKVNAVKTRVFEAMPQHATLAFRMYFLDFNKHVMKNRITNEICVGINPASCEWTKLAHHLLTKGKNWIAGDCKNFDGSLCHQILGRICDQINDWYDDGQTNCNIRTTLWQHIYAADVMVRGDVIRQTHAQPSGNPLTVIINSLFNAIMMRIAYLILKEENGLDPQCDFDKHVAFATYGDDNLLSVSPAIISWYNQETITEALAKIGVTYTDEAKTGELVAYRKPEEVSFLKRYFVPDADGHYFAPMDLANVLEMTNWIRGNKPRAATLENCECVLDELVHHGKDVYEQWGKRIQLACYDKGLVLHLPSFAEKIGMYFYTCRQLQSFEFVPLY